MMDKAQILIVDDDRANINILGTMLSELYDVIVALNGEQALQVVESNPDLDLIILDIQMPGIDGFQVCQTIKDNAKTKDIPVIFITAKGNEGDQRKGLNLGAVDYIIKPFSQPIVELRVKNQLELKRQRNLLTYLCNHDSLTDLFNRSKFDEFLQHEWKHAMRVKTSISLIFIDIDYFKKYNDFYGHTAGDDCIKNVAKAINNSLERAVDLAARYGGEEFVCVLPNTQLSGAVSVAETIRNNVLSLQILHQKSPDEQCVTISAGISSMVPDSSNTPLKLIQKADQMLYKAKNSGRNKVISH